MKVDCTFHEKHFYFSRVDGAAVNINDFCELVADREIKCCHLNIKSSC